MFVDVTTRSARIARPSASTTEPSKLRASTQSHATAATPTAMVAVVMPTRRGWSRMPVAAKRPLAPATRTMRGRARRAGNCQHRRRRQRGRDAPPEAPVRRRGFLAAPADRHGDARADGACRRQPGREHGDADAEGDRDDDRRRAGHEPHLGRDQVEVERGRRRDHRQEELGERIAERHADHDARERDQERFLHLLAPDGAWACADGGQHAELPAAPLEAGRDAVERDQIGDDEPDHAEAPEEQPERAHDVLQIRHELNIYMHTAKPARGESKIPAAG